MLGCTVKGFGTAPAELEEAEPSRDDRIGAGSFAELSLTLGSPFPSRLQPTTSQESPIRMAQGRQAKEGRRSRQEAEVGSSCFINSMTQLISLH